MCCYEKNEVWMPRKQKQYNSASIIIFLADALYVCVYIYIFQIPFNQFLLDKSFPWDEGQVLSITQLTLIEKKKILL